MTPEEAYRRVAGQFPPDFVGRFYSPGEAVGLGKGKIYDAVRCAVFDRETALFLSVDALAYVLTHECDVDAENERIFNDYVLVCPIIRLEHLVAEYEDELAGELLPAFLGNLGARNVSRLVYLPAIEPVLPYGGVLYMNQITHTDVNSFVDGKAVQVCAVTAFGLSHIEYALENHLLRPKAERLAFAPHVEAHEFGESGLDDVAAHADKSPNLLVKIWRCLFPATR